MNETPTPPQGGEAKPEWREREVIEGKSGRWMWHPTFANGKPAQIFILDAPTPPQGEEGGEVGIKHHLALRRRYEAKKKEISALTAELAALREEMGKKEENYEKVWDAAIKRDYYEKYSAMELWQHLEIPPDKTTFINNLKKGKE
jgi:hypothetical protein